MPTMSAYVPLPSVGGGLVQPHRHGQGSKLLRLNFHRRLVVSGGGWRSNLGLLLGSLEWAARGRNEVVGDRPACGE